LASRWPFLALMQIGQSLIRKRRAGFSGAARGTPSSHYRESSNPTTLLLPLVRSSAILNRLGNGREAKSATTTNGRTSSVRRQHFAELKTGSDPLHEMLACLFSEKSTPNTFLLAKAAKSRWRCRNCGRVVEGEEAPKSCPTCQHPQAFFEVLAENY